MNVRLYRVILYFSDPRFIIGILLYFLGYFTNRWADHHLRFLRETKGETGKLYPVNLCPSHRVTFWAPRCIRF